MTDADGDGAGSGDGQRKRSAAEAFGDATDTDVQVKQEIKDEPTADPGIPHPPSLPSSSDAAVASTSVPDAASSSEPPPKRQRKESVQVKLEQPSALQQQPPERPPERHPPEQPPERPPEQPTFTSPLSVHGKGKGGGGDDTDTLLRLSTTDLSPADHSDNNFFGPFAPKHGYKGPSIAQQEQDARLISFRVIRNDGSAESMILLTNLKIIFQKQLPKMPKEYIARLVYDTSHLSMAIVKKDGCTILGGITYKPFFERKFAEIVFCAITTSEQVKGYGSHLMNHLKSYIRRTGDIRHFLTYADNYAIGYFKKQGFSTTVTLNRSLWAGYIKDYEGGTIMQCSIIPRIDYFRVREILLLQHKAVCRKIRERSRGAIVYPGLTAEQLEQAARDPMSIPGIAESGWTAELSARHSQSVQRSPLYRLCIRLVDDMRANTHSWPFREPVDPKQVADYYEIITDPMDLQTLEERVDAECYPDLEAFKRDVQKIFDNCRAYNAPSTNYYKCANKLEEVFKERLKEREQIMEEMRRDGYGQV